jgi:hypothetical protein
LKPGTCRRSEPLLIQQPCGPSRTTINTVLRQMFGQARQRAEMSDAPVNLSASTHCWSTRRCAATAPASTASPAIPPTAPDRTPR